MPERMSLLSSAADAKVPRKELMARGREDGFAKQKNTGKRRDWSQGQCRARLLPSHPVALIFMFNETGTTRGVGRQKSVC